jgi:diaminopropionate ammonia-lyase
MAKLFFTAFRAIRNPGLDRMAAAPEEFLTPEDTARAAAAIQSWPGYAATPLVPLPGVARALGIAGLWYKDESHRFGVGSFKPVGGGYAVMQVVAREVSRLTGAPVDASTLLSGGYAPIAAGVTVACATDGNHGRAVAWAARLFGCRAVVYLASHVSENRERAIASYGASTVRAKGNHEDAMVQMVADARREGWHIISETRSASDPQIAFDTLAGYSTIANEIVDALDGVQPSHWFVQAGVGGLAAATTAYSTHRWGAARPRTVVVEAQNADCVHQSLLAGRPKVVTGDLETIMAGLAAGEVSGYAWDILGTMADASVVLPDDAAMGAMRLLADGTFGDQHVVGGESGVASLAAVIVTAQDPSTRAALEIDSDSRIVVMGTEGATDPDVYARIVGRSPQDVERA